MILLWNPKGPIVNVSVASCTTIYDFYSGITIVAHIFHILAVEREKVEKNTTAVLRSARIIYNYYFFNHCTYKRSIFVTVSPHP